MGDAVITVLVVDGHQTFAELLGVALRDWSASFVRTWCCSIRSCPTRTASPLQN
jgi:hypothetical protein